MQFSIQIPTTIYGLRRDAPGEQGYPSLVIYSCIFY
jgi:hypothetical protein